LGWLRIVLQFLFFIFLFMGLFLYHDLVRVFDSLILIDLDFCCYFLELFLIELSILGWLIVGFHNYFFICLHEIILFL
jgi:hypothetical protein